MRLPLHTATLVSGVMAGTLLIAGCGGSSPLDALSEQQQEALGNAWSQRLEVVAAPQLDAEKMTARARGLNEACRGLDESVPFLKAVKATCGPTAMHAKLEAVLPERCVAASAVCRRAVERITDANDAQIESLEALNEAAQSAIADPACRAEFVTTKAQLDGYRDLRRAYAVLGLGARQDDGDFLQLGRNQIADAGVVIARSGDARQQRLRFYDACKLDPPGT